jgi:AcrR family transcriptional regulator
MPRPRSLTDAAVATAALAVLDREGLPALSMRSVAAELGTGTMSLYRYVADREQLERLVLDLVLAGLDTTGPAGLPWDARIRVLAGRVRTAVSAHPAVTPLFLTHRHVLAALHRWGESVLAALTEAGLAGVDRVVAFRALVSYVVGALQAESLGPLAGTGTVVLAGLPVEEFPLLAATSSDARTLAPEEEFTRGLDALLRGLVTP